MGGEGTEAKVDVVVVVRRIVVICLPEANDGDDDDSDNDSQGKGEGWLSMPKCWPFLQHFVGRWLPPREPP